MLRGLAISMICLHNFMHLICNIKECEYDFYPENVEMLLSFKSLSPGNLFFLLFSFFGWYGVMAFVFLSGYGLVMKYEKKGAPLHPWSYLKHNYVKLLLLMSVPWFLYSYGHLFTPVSAYQLTFTINLFSPDDIMPGVYWYFGLALQLYVLYVFFYYKRSDKWLYGVSLAMLVLGFAFMPLSPNPIHYHLRYNSPLWLPVFLMGVWFARGGKDSSVMDFVASHRTLSILAFFILWVCSSVMKLLWVLSPIFFVLLMITIFHERRLDDAPHNSTGKISSAFRNCLVFLGTISPGIFVWHPYFRRLAIQAYYAGDMNVWLILLLYLLVTLLVSSLYTPLYRRVLPKVLLWLK